MDIIYSANARYESFDVENFTYTLKNRDRCGLTNVCSVLVVVIVIIVVLSYGIYFNLAIMTKRSQARSVGLKGTV